MYKAIIIDDEAKARRLLKALLEEHCPQIEIVEEAEDVPGGVKAIHQHAPDIVFSDIDMPGYNGFQLLDFVDKANFELIYCTGFHEYALKAFEVSAIDYLLKPLRASQLVNAVERAIRLRASGSHQVPQRLEALKENIHNTVLKKIALPVSYGLIFIDISDLMLLEADGAYTNVFLKNGQKLLISKKLKDFENMLSGNPVFFRTHRSYIINRECIHQYVRSDGGSIIMSDNTVVPLARERKDDFQQMIGDIRL